MPEETIALTQRALHRLKVVGACQRPGAVFKPTGRPSRVPPKHRHPTLKTENYRVFGISSTGYRASPADRGPVALPPRRAPCALARLGWGLFLVF